MLAGEFRTFFYLPIKFGKILIARRAGIEALTAAMHSLLQFGRLQYQACTIGQSLASALAGAGRFFVRLASVNPNAGHAVQKKTILIDLGKVNRRGEKEFQARMQQATNEACLRAVDEIWQVSRNLRDAGIKQPAQQLKTASEST
ncbi:MAG: hypothetical protein ACREOO_25015 [bacterium]